MDTGQAKNLKMAFDFPEQLWTREVAPRILILKLENFNFKNASYKGHIIVLEWEISRILGHESGPKTNHRKLLSGSRAYFWQNNGYNWKNLKNLRILEKR